MNKRIGAWVLLYALLASLAGTMLSCKSSAKPPAVSSTPAKTPDQDSALPIADGYKVTMDYSIVLLGNIVAANTVGKEPLSFVQGKHEIWPALETAVAGMKAGERKSIPLTPEQTFGPYDESKKITVKREQLPADAKVGGLVSTKDGRRAKIVDLSAGSAALDFNHPLAGKDVVFDVTILKVEKQP